MPVICYFCAAVMKGNDNTICLFQKASPKRTEYEREKIVQNSKEAQKMAEKQSVCHIISVHGCDMAASWNECLSFHPVQHHPQDTPIRRPGTSMYGHGSPGHGMLWFSVIGSKLAGQSWCCSFLIFVLFVLLQPVRDQTVPNEFLRDRWTPFERRRMFPIVNAIPCQ